MLGLLLGTVFGFVGLVLSMFEKAGKYLGPFVYIIGILLIILLILLIIKLILSVINSIVSIIEQIKSKKAK